MIVKILIGLAVVVGALVVVIVTRPDTFHVERSVNIAAPPERAYSQVADFHRWSTWSPWEKLDPDMKRTYSGAPTGAGAEYAWTGNKQTGEGRMTIVDAAAPSRIAIKLEFFKPAATNQATFVFAQTATGTKVTWAMDGKNNFMAKAPPSRHGHGQARRRRLREGPRCDEGERRARRSAGRHRQLSTDHQDRGREAMKFLLTYTATDTAPPTPERMAAIGKFTQEMTPLPASC